jgi:hypothetical protein
MGRRVLPPDDELLRAAREKQCTSHAQTAKAVGANDSTVQKYAKENPELGEMLEVIYRDNLAAKRKNIAAGVETREIGEAEILRVDLDEAAARAKAERDARVDEEATLRRLENALRTSAPKYKPPPPLKKGKETPGEFVLLLSDLHAGEVVDSDKVLGMNAYNWEIMRARLARVRDRLLSHAEHAPWPIARLHVFMLGDMLSGAHHDDLAWTNELTDAEALVQLAEDLSVWTSDIAQHFQHVSVAGVPGNHPRRNRKPSAKLAANNDDWALYHIIRLLHEQSPTVDFSIRRGDFNTAMVCDRWRFLLMHGDGIRSSMPGVPWGGVVRRVTTLQQQFQAGGMPIDYVTLGHFHTRNALEGVGVETYLNASLKGLDEYSLKQFGSGRPPSQMLLKVHPAHGVTDVSYIDLVDRHPAGMPRPLAA